MNQPHLPYEEPLITKKWNFKGSKHNASGIFITGATSYVGLHVIQMLCKFWDGSIHLLVRAKTREEATARILNGGKQYAIKDIDKTKLTVYPGNVFEENFGLDKKAFLSIQHECGHVLHLAMLPLYHYPYEYFQKHWLPELEKMIEFCGDTDFPKFLYYPSSYNANFFKHQRDFERLNTNAWQSGYAGFKWVANKVLENANEQGLNSCIFDIPLVVGSKQNGICPANYSIWHILDIFLNCKMFIDFKFRIIPVDVLARIITDVMILNANGGKYNFIRPVLSETVTQEFIKPYAKLLGIKYVQLDALREACLQKRKFNFLIPSDFYKLLQPVNELPAILPVETDLTSFPNVKGVFVKNLMYILQKKVLK